MPTLIGIFCMRDKGMRVAMEVTIRENLFKALAANATDLAIMGRPPDGLELEVYPFMENPLVMLAAPDHPLAGRRHIPLADLAGSTHHA